MLFRSGVSGPSSSCVWNPRVFADDARGWQCPFVLCQCMKVKSESEVPQSCPTLSDPMDYSLPGSSVHGVFQARILELGAIAFSDRCCYKQLKLESYTVSQSQAHLNSSLFHILHTSQESTVASPGFSFLFYRYSILTHIYGI